MIDKTIGVYLGVNTLPTIVECTEGDTMWRWHFEVYFNSQRWTIPSGGTVMFTGKKADGNVFDMLETIENNEAVVVCDEQMTAAVGPAACVLRFLDTEGKTVASTPIVLAVKPNPQTQGPMSETVLSAYNEVLQLLGDAIDMPAKVTEWLDEHITQETGYVLDTSLTIAGAAADAKATGDAVNYLKSAIPTGLAEIQPYETIADTRLGYTQGTPQYPTLIQSSGYNVLKYKILPGTQMYFSGSLFGLNGTFRSFFLKGADHEVVEMIEDWSDIQSGKSVTIPNDATEFWGCTNTPSLSVLVTKATSYLPAASEESVEVIGDKADDLESNLLSYEKITVPQSFDGFYDAAGGLQPASAPNYEKHTDQILCNNMRTITVRLVYPESKYMWLSANTWKKDGTFISRDVLVGSGYHTDETIEYTIPTNAYKISFAYRTFNIAVNLYLWAKPLDLPQAVSATEDKIEAYQHIEFISRECRINWFPPMQIESAKECKRNLIDSVRLSVRKTSDGVFVLSHDASINDEARNADGSAISSTVNIADSTYDELSIYDFGIKYGSQFAGMKIPKLSDLLEACAEIGLKVTLEIKYAMLQDDVTAVCKLLAKNSFAQSAWISTDNTDVLTRFHTTLPGVNCALIAHLSSERIQRIAQYKSSECLVRLDFFDSDTMTEALYFEAAQNNIALKIGSVYSVENIKQWVNGGCEFIEVSNIPFPYSYLNDNTIS